ncbi:ATP-binding protein [Bradyrhizobium ottawaense]|uniref:Histidine kinase-, DNA gyrase B-, and HSP90-like ATPase n=1 Tax=Bradyrhizobium ottawaense TaxID=931866 RepID=A0ABY0QHD9_9BRAD|nr:ATP-binding protein [Bradyrhizobium ottawaense]SDK44519.1 Histidine kinase-, DNA gyrase B-, and HSP90-like ATPase [Bradyrhizobium ottawaense]
MKLGMKQHAHTATGVKKEIKVAFETNAVAFYATFSGLASDKIGYPVRELCTNAWDAARGNFEVHLPTYLNPVFKVRDFGTGMSEFDMENVYAKPYASKKRESNDQVGGWGIGSKSPYAYLIGDTGAGSYNVTSYFEGVMRCYVMSLADDGMPKMELLFEGPSDQPAGMEVSFAVNKSDINTFRDRAHQILWSFNPRPTILPAIEWDEPVIESQGDKWIKYKKGSVPFYGPRVRMGCVMYPITLNKIETSGFLDSSDTVLFDAPIGSLKVTLSREDIAYDETTITTLKSLISEYENTFIEQVRLKVTEANSLFEACSIFEDETNTLGSTRQASLRRLVKWEGHNLSEYVSKEDCKVECLSEGWTSFDKFEDGQARTKWAADATVVIEHNPSYSFGRFQMAELVGKKVLWVRCKRIVRDQVLYRLGNPEVIDLDSFKVPVSKRTSKTIRKRKTLMVLSGGRVQRITQDVDLAEGGYMVEATPTYGGRRRRGGGDSLRLTSDGVSMQFSDAESVIMTAVEFGLIEVGQVILVKDYDKEVSGDWNFIADDLLDALRDRVDVSEFTGLHHKTLGHLNHQLHDLAKMAVFVKAPDDVRQFQADLSALHVALDNNSTASTQTDKAFSALRKLGVQINKPDVVCPIGEIEKRYEALCERYLLLRSINEENGYYHSHRQATKVLKLNHYFALLARPEVANDNNDVEEELVLNEAA